MKTKHSLFLSFFVGLIFLLANNTAKAQNLSFSIERSSGILSIYDNNQNVTALYDIKVAEFDIYNEENKYVGTIQAKNNKISPAELQPKEYLKVSKIQLQDKNAATAITIDAKKSTTVTLK